MRSIAFPLAPHDTMERVTNTLRNNYVAAQDIGQGQHDNRSLCTQSATKRNTVRRHRKAKGQKADQSRRPVHGQSYRSSLRGGRTEG